MRLNAKIFIEGHTGLVGSALVRALDKRSYRNLIFLMQNYDNDEIINVGTGEDISIADLAHLIADVVGFSGDLIIDSTKPDGMPRRLLNVSRLHELAFFHRTILVEGIKSTYD